MYAVQNSVEEVNKKTDASRHRFVLKAFNPFQKTF